MDLIVHPALRRSPPALVACDWNGTLVADVDRAHRAAVVTLARRGLPPPTRRGFRASFRLPLEAFFHDLGVAPSELGHAVSEWNAGLAGIPPNPAPGLTAMLASLRSVGIPVGVISAAARTVIEQDARYLGIQDAIAFVRAGVTDKTRILASLVGSHTGPVIYLGDTEHDITAARQAGAVPVAVSYGYRPGTALAAAGASVVLSDLSRLPTVLALATPKALR